LSSARRSCERRARYRGPPCISGLLHISCVDDPLLAQLTATDDLPVLDLFRRNDLQLITLHAFGIELGGNLGLQLLTGLLRDCRSNGESQNQRCDDIFHFLLLTPTKGFEKFYAQPLTAGVPYFADRPSPRPGMEGQARMHELT
jgi:hypothetical protein